MIFPRLTFLFLLPLFCAPVFAQGAPVGKPPATKPAAPMQLTPQAAPKTPPAPDAVPPPVLGLPQKPAQQQQPQPERRGVMNRADPFTPVQRTTIGKINKIYNAIREMNGQFTQVEGSGATSMGKFYITKPGRVRFAYDAPTTVDIVSDGEQLAVRDKKLGTQDVYPLWQTPLRYLLKDNLNLLEDAHVISILQDANVVTVTIEEEGALTQGRLMLYFSAQDYSLLQWSITDGRGVETNVTVTNVAVNKPNDARIFAIQ